MKKDMPNYMTYLVVAAVLVILVMVIVSNQDAEEDVVELEEPTTVVEQPADELVPPAAPEPAVPVETVPPAPVEPVAPVEEPAAPSVPLEEPAAGSADIMINRFNFDPETVTVSVGSTVTWKNLDDRRHIIDNNALDIRSGNLDEGGTFSYTFTEAGEYDILDPIFGIRGTVVVE